MSAEVVHIFILLVYALMTQKFGIRSWTLWAVSLAVELTRLGIHSDAIVLNHRAEKVHQLLYAERDKVRWFQFFVTTKLRKFISSYMLCFDIY
jgi:hypothetical protein